MMGRALKRARGGGGGGGGYLNHDTHPPLTHPPLTHPPLAHPPPTSSDIAVFLRLVHLHAPTDPAVRQLVSTNLITLDPLVLRDGVHFRDLYLLLLQHAHTHEVMQRVRLGVQMEAQAQSHKTQMEALRLRLEQYEARERDNPVTLHTLIEELQRELALANAQCEREQQRNVLLEYRVSEQTNLIGRAHAEQMGARREQLMRVVNKEALELMSALQESVSPEVFDKLHDVIVTHVDAMRVAAGQALV